MIPRSELYYFVPGQVILHLEHDDIDDIHDLEEVVVKYIGGFGNGNPWNQLTLQWNQTITFPLIKTDDGKNISLVLTDAGEVYRNQDRLIDLLVELYDLLGEGIEISHSPSIVLRTITPNWLTSCAPHQPATGGPGSWPVPAEQTGVDQWKFTHKKSPYSTNEKVGVEILDSLKGDYQSISDYQRIPADIRLNRESPTVEIVEVAILDTAPFAVVLDIALKRWHDHPLLLSLWGEDRKLELNPDDFLDWPDVEHFSQMSHRYKMPDHGLFVAGIINSIAPQARLKLYKVLDEYGMGSYTSVCNGLKGVLDDLKKSRFVSPTRGPIIHKLIINMSLVVNLPIVDKEMNYLHVDIGLTDRYPGKGYYFNKMSVSIQEILRHIEELTNVFVVAAAGNDAKDQEQRPPARYPAAFQGVIGVGALPKVSALDSEGHQIAASYSNKCDLPLSVGCMTLGGEPGSENGVLGVYIHEFPVDHGSNDPDYPAQQPQPGYLRGVDDYSPDLSEIEYIPNQFGWAWWAGTSFATPIISGLLAAAWGSNNWQSASDVQLFLSRASGLNRTSDDERVIVVTQP